MKVVQLQAEQVQAYFEDLVRLKYRSVRHSFPENSEGLEAYCREKLAELPNYINAGKALVLAAVEKGKIIGFLWAYPRVFLHEERLFINGIAVDGEYEGTGTAQQLLNHLENLARERNCTAIDLMVAPFNGRAVGFYRKHGFQDERIQMVLDLR